MWISQTGTFFQHQNWVRRCSDEGRGQAGRGIGGPYNIGQCKNFCRRVKPCLVLRWVTYSPLPCLPLSMTKMPPQHFFHWCTLADKHLQGGIAMDDYFGKPPKLRACFTDQPLNLPLLHPTTTLFEAEITYVYKYIETCLLHGRTSGKPTKLAWMWRPKNM